MSAGAAIAEAYGSTGAAWEQGPGRIYNQLARVVADLTPVPITGRVVVDLGTGTGAASRAIARAGGHPIAIDAAWGMLRVDAARRPPAAQADALALPLASASVGGVVAAFSLNHLADPVAGFAECARVCERGSPILASAYAADDTHPVKHAAIAALTEAGFVEPGWAVQLRADRVPKLATAGRCATAAAAAGLDAQVHRLRVPFPELATRDLVEWRLGMAYTAPFVSTLDRSARDRVVDRAVELLGADAPPLERSILVIAATR